MVKSTLFRCSYWLFHEELNRLLLGLDVIRWNSHVVGFVLFMSYHICFSFNQYFNSIHSACCVDS